MSEPTLAQLSKALDRARFMGYNCSICVGRYGDADHFSCNLSNNSVGGGQMRVSGDGATLEEAVRKCFSNFPENPLDGTGWLGNRLAAPAPKPDSIDADFTEVPKE